MPQFIGFKCAEARIYLNPDFVVGVFPDENSSDACAVVTEGGAEVRIDEPVSAVVARLSREQQ